jgi:sulfane dehydrogenase subunit SoxC
MAADRDVRGPRLSRRRLLALTSSAAAALALGQPGSAQSPASGTSPSPSSPTDPTKVQGAPISHLGNRSPFVHLERTFADNPTRTASWSLTPLQDLNGIITPSGLHFECHHAGVPTIDPAKHRLLIHGLVDRPMEYTVEDIKRFPSSTRIMFLECSGNSLDAWGTPKPDATAQSLHGLASTSEWTGVPVSTLLKEVGVKPEAKWALAEGADAAVMDRSIPIEKLMSDAFIAYGQNGEDIRPEQDSPMRLMLPGW